MHFLGIVFGEGEFYLDSYDENTPVKKYEICSKEDYVKKIKIEYDDFYNLVQDRIKEGVDYYIQNFKNLKKECTPEYYQESLDESGYIEENEKIYSTYNTDSRFDWYVLGGRWGGYLPSKDGNDVNIITKKDIDWDKFKEKNLFPFCYVTEEGDWISIEDFNDRSEYNTSFLNYINSIEDDVLLKVTDFHV